MTIMQIAIRPNTLEMFVEELQQRLSVEGLIDPLQIHCNLHQDSLLVLVQHTLGVKLNVTTVKQNLQKVIQALQPEFAHQVGICFKVEGESQPYDYYSFKLERHLSSNLGRNVLYTTNHHFVPTSRLRSSQAESESAKMSGEVSSNWQWQEIDTEGEGSHRSDASDQSDRDHLGGDFQYDLFDFDENPFDASDLDLLVVEDESSVKDEFLPIQSAVDLNVDLRQSQLIEEQKEILLPQEPIAELDEELGRPKEGHSSGLIGWLVSLGIVGLLGGSCYYLLSRPCVIGECEPIALADQLSQKSAEAVAPNKLSINPGLAQDQLEQAIGHLKTIPVWSFHYRKSQNLQESYQKQLDDLERLVIALNNAKEATLLSQEPPHPTATWRNIKKTWEGAIDKLAAISINSYVRALADQKLTEYQANLKTVNQRLKFEEQAEQKLALAVKSANVAAATEGAVQKPETWELIDSNWQSAVDSISTIPKGTSAYQKAQELLPKYQVKLTMARDRAGQEKTGTEAYNQALNLAKQANVFQQRQSWSQAVEYWDRALRLVESVPKKSSYYLQAQSLISNYESALQEAEGQQKQAQKLQAAGDALERSCQGKPPVCNFALNQDLITVKLTPAYVEKIHKIATTGKSTKKNRILLEKHIKTLQEALEAISENAQIPIAVYNPQGEILGTHTP